MTTKNDFTALLEINDLRKKFIFDLASLLGNEGRVKHNFNSRDFDNMGLSESGLALIQKIDYKIEQTDFKSILRMLYSFKYGTKRLRSYYGTEKEYTWINKDGVDVCSMGTNDKQAHFRWNGGKRYLLSDKEIDLIQSLIGHVNAVDVGYNPRVSKYEEEEDDFNLFMNQSEIKINVSFKEVKDGVKKFNFLIKGHNGEFGGVFTASITTGTICDKELLYSLERNELEDFEDWCNNMDYDSDSIKNLNKYRNCVAEYKSVLKIFGHQGLNKLNDILQDY